jgi:urease accessory protein
MFNNFNGFTRRFFLSVSTFTLAISIPAIAQAHVGAGETVGFWHGLQHPIGGLDHILAMLAVGLWAAQLGGHAVWSVPLAFVSVMSFGGVLGIFNMPIPFVEQGIVVSNLILGGLVLMATRLPLAASISIVGLLAIFHGYAHGAEMPTQASALEYAAGFMVATAILHLSGISIALLMNRLLSKQSVRFAGGGIILGGIYVLVNSLSGS